eukprot:14174240-Ditylum_brightwellii.AAC.1
MTAIITVDITVNIAADIVGDIVANITAYISAIISANITATIKQPPAKKSRHHPIKYNMGSMTREETQATEDLTVLNADKTKSNYDKAIKKYNKFAPQSLPCLSQYSELNSKILTSNKAPHGLKVILSNFAQFLVTDKQDNGDDYAPNVCLYFLSDFKTVFYKNVNFQHLERITEINMHGKRTNTWYSELYQRLQMHTFVEVVSKGLAVMKKTVSMGCKVVIAVNKYLTKCDTPEGYENHAVLTALRQAVECGGNIGLTIWQSSYWNHDTKHWEMEWPEEKTGSTDIMNFIRDKMIWKLACFIVWHVIS